MVLEVPTPFTCRTDRALSTALALHTHTHTHTHTRHLDTLKQDPQPEVNTCTALRTWHWVPPSWAKGRTFRNLQRDQVACPADAYSCKSGGQGWNLEV